jgi:putative endopeptidase
MRFYTYAYAAVLLAFAGCNSNTGTTSSAGKKDILAANLDTTVNPADDFFDYANGGWIKANPIPGDQSSWGIGGLVAEENRNRLRKIAEDAAKANGAQGSTEQKIGDFYITAMDSGKIERDGIKPLQPWLDKINAVADGKTLQSTFAELDKIGIGGLWACM